VGQHYHTSPLKKQPIKATLVFSFCAIGRTNDDVEMVARPICLNGVFKGGCLYVLKPTIDDGSVARDSGHVIPCILTNLRVNRYFVMAGHRSVAWTECSELECSVIGNYRPGGLTGFAGRLK
jgi:hypothetical protein